MEPPQALPQKAQPLSQAVPAANPAPGRGGTAASPPQRPGRAVSPPPEGTFRGSGCPCAGAAPVSSSGWTSCCRRGCALPSRRGCAPPPPPPPLAEPGADLGRGKGSAATPPQNKTPPNHPRFTRRTPSSPARLLPAPQLGTAGPPPPLHPSIPISLPQPPAPQPPAQPLPPPGCSPCRAGARSRSRLRRRGSWAAEEIVQLREGREGGGRIAA